MSAKIMIVEDEAVIALELRMHLQDFGYQVVGIATSADEALALAQQTLPDLALMDIVLRGERDGVHTSALLRDEQGVPVVYLTAHSDPATLQRAISGGSYGYLLKPYRPDELRAAIEVALGKHAIERRQSSRWRELAAELQTTGERERTQLAEQLHEQIAQEVAAARFAVSTLSRADSETVAAILQQLGQATRNVTTLADQLRPTYIGSGLLPALNRFATQLFQDTGIAWQLNADELWVFEPLATPLFRIAEAALINVKLHSGARQVDIELREQGEHILLHRGDDGQGRGTAHGDRPEAFGFERMRRWVSSIGGELSISAQPGRGTQIQVMLRRQ